MISMKRIVYRICLLLFVSFAFINGFSQVRLPGIIGSHMVLQQKSLVNLWGWADPGENITISAEWDTTNYHVTCSSGALWSIKIKTPKAGGPFRIHISGHNAIILEDV